LKAGLSAVLDELPDHGADLGGRRPIASGHFGVNDAATVLAADRSTTQTIVRPRMDGTLTQRAYFPPN
jgi:hypothetical protein